MKHKAVLLICLLAAAALGCREDEEAPAPQEGEGAPEETAQGMGEMSGEIDLVFYDADFESGDTQRPAFMVRSERFRLEGEQAWVFEDATATIYGAEGGLTLIEAGKGTFDNASKQAHLAGGVSGRMGVPASAPDGTPQWAIELEEMSWLNEEGAAVSEKDVRLGGEQTRLAAKGMRLVPKLASLTLMAVSGYVGLAQADTAPAGGMVFNRLDFLEPAPEVEFRNNRLHRISGGVKVRLESGQPGTEPLVLAADEIRVTWPEGDAGAAPSQIALEGDVEVDSAQGTIQSRTALLDTRASTLRFEEEVTGSSETISSFRADSVEYDLETGGSLMKNLRATDVPLSGGGSEGQRYSRMDVEMAPEVVFSQGRVERLSGGVRIRMRPPGGAGKDLRISANEVAFIWAGNQNRPSAIRLRGGVAVDSGEGVIRARSAEMNTARNELVFTGNVKGSTAEIDEFDADRIAFDLASEDSIITNLRAQDVPMGLETQDGDAAAGYDRMDIVKAPEVLMKSGRFERIRGGVELVLEGTGPQDEPMLLKGGQMTFAYGEEGTLQQVQLDGSVDVSGELGALQAERAALDTAAKKLRFSGDVRGDTPIASGLRTAAIVWDLETRSVFLPGNTQVAEFSHHRGPDPSLLTLEDIKDWRVLLSSYQAQAEAAAPSPGRHMAALMEPLAARQLGNLPADRDLDLRTKDAVLDCFNSLLKRPGLYDAEAWRGLELNEETRQVLEGGLEKLDSRELTSLNRRLMVVAFPEAVAAPD